MAAQPKVTIEEWCKEEGYSKFVSKLTGNEMAFTYINDLFPLSSSDLNDVCSELGLKFGKKSKFLQAIEAARNKLSPNVSNNSDESKEESKDESKDESKNNDHAALLIKPNPKQRPLVKHQAKKTVSLVFVGETGVGKSTLLKSIEDFINGVPYEQVKCTPKGIDGGTQSVTQETSQYELSNNEWAVNIIDTPGIGDTRGIDQDDKNMGDITKFLGDYAEFNAVCILIKRGSSRLTERFRYIVNEIRANLPKDVNKNFITIMTRADVAIPDEDTRKAIEELRLPTDNIVPINNLAYEEMDLSKYSKDSPIYKATIAKAKSDYAANQQYLQILLESAAKLKSYRGDKIKQLKIKRDLLKEEVGLLQKKIQDSFELEKEINEKLAELEQAKQAKKKYSDFSKLHQWTEKNYVKEHGKISTSCFICSKVCHIDCGLGYGENLNGCACAGSNGKCNRCSHSMSNHTHLGWKTIATIKSEYKEDADAKKKWQDANHRATMIQQAQQTLLVRKRQTIKARDKQATKIGQLYKELSEMAIIGHNESAEKYMQECKKAIENGTLTKEDKKQRLDLIDSMIDKMKILRNVVQQYVIG